MRTLLLREVCAGAIPQDIQVLRVRKEHERVLQQGDGDYRAFGEEARA